MMPDDSLGVTSCAECAVYMYLESTVNVSIRRQNSKQYGEQNTLHQQACTREDVYLQINIRECFQYAWE